jgi:N-acetylmuramoyl-L-alanine amidase
VTNSPLLRRGADGDAVRDVQQRLVTAGTPVRPTGHYDDATERAVRAFQEQRGLRVDGVCGPETWGALIESSYALGDRLLYLCQPMLRGDDVAELQRRCNGLGFDAGREDGIFGPATERALAAFQRDAGIATDKVCGPATVAALARLGSLAAGSVASVREREHLRNRTRQIAGTRIFVGADLGLAALGNAVAGALRRQGAIVALDTAGEDAALVATSANLFEAEVFVALTTGEAQGARCAYFANKTFRSEGGFCVAERLTDALAGVIEDVQPPIGRTYRLLRDTRMAAVVCELLAADDAEATGLVAARLADVANAIADGIRRGVEEPLDALRS